MDAFADAEFVGNFFVDEGGVEGHVAFDEEVFVAAVDVEADFFQFVGVGGFDDLEDGVFVVVLRQAVFAGEVFFTIEIAHHIVPHVGVAVDDLFVCENAGTQGCGGGEQLGVFGGHDEGAVAAHGQAGNRAVLFRGTRAIVGVYVGNKFFDEEVFILHFAIVAVDVPAHPRVGHHDDHRRYLTLEFVGNDLGFAKLRPSRFVVAIAVEQVEHGILPVGFVIVGRQVNVVFHVFAERGAFHFQTLFHQALLSKGASGDKQEEVTEFFHAHTVGFRIVEPQCI